jgi:hypothetical protein
MPFIAVIASGLDLKDAVPSIIAALTFPLRKGYGYP